MTPKTTLVRVLFLLATVVSLGLLIARHVGVVVPRLLVAVGWLVIEIKILTKGLELFRVMRSKGQRPTVPGRLNPLSALLLGEIRLANALVCSFMPCAPMDGFSFRDAPEYEMFRYVLWLSVLVELPLMIGIANVAPSFALYRWKLDVVVAVLSVYALLAYRADRHAIRSTAHAISGGLLRLRMGLRMESDIPLDAIDAVENVQIGTWRKRAHAWRAEGLDVAKVSPMDKPNVAFRVERGRALFYWMHGAVTTPDMVGLYVDKPDKLVAALIREKRSHQEQLLTCKKDHMTKDCRIACREDLHA